MPVERFDENPLIRPEDVPPSHEAFEVVGTFNPAAFEFGGKFGLIVRVAERPVQTDPATVSVPTFDTEAQPPKLELTRLRRDDPAWDFTDPRIVLYRPEGAGQHHHLTSLSHLRVAWSEDGRRFRLEDGPAALWPRNGHERFGIEDPRVTRINGLYLITHTAVSESGVCVGLVTTAHFRLFAGHGIILPPENKDACFFPAKIDGEYVILHRPAGAWCRPGMWIARSSDMVSWGRHEFLAAPRPTGWDSLRIGAGPPPIRTPDGWLVIYHGAGEDGYGLGAMLLDLAEPARVLARSAEPLMLPETEYEKHGFVEDVVFCNGLIERPGGELWLYYGGADRVTAGCRCDLPTVLDLLK